MKKSWKIKWDPVNTKGKVEKINEIVLEVFKKANVDQ